jgi:hypothetical protein
MEELDNKGKVKKTDEMWNKIVYDTNGKTKSELTKYLENGIDVTEKKKVELGKQYRNSNRTNMSMSFSDINPFQKNKQPGISFKWSGLIESNDNKECAVFDFKSVYSNKTQSGKAWIDIKTGAPVNMEYINTPNPQFIAWLSNSVQFNYTDEGGWYPVSMKFEGAGGFLMMKMHVRSTITLSDYSKNTFVSQFSN